MSNKQQKLTKTQLKFQHTDKKSLIVGSIIATIIGFTPYLFYLYESVPKEKDWSTFLFTYHSGYFENANTAMWILTGKAIPLLLLLIWFFTNRHWWYHVLLVPIAMYTYQIVQQFVDENSNQLDEFQLIYMVPIMAIVIPSIYLIRAQIFNKINETNKSMEELEEEFKMSPRNFWDKIKQYF